jgi:para-nitrobenzyl esterase
VLKAYGINDRAKQPNLVFTEALTDLVFRLQARRFAQAHQGRTHFYEFKWKSPVYDSGLGACHAIELPFVFDTLSTVRGPKGLAGPNPPQEIADRLNALWAEYAKTGELPWPEYTAETQLVCTPETGEVQRDAEMPAARFIP